MHPVQSSLRVALEANGTAYRRAAQTSVPGECWDVLVLTATNEKQAEGYRRELSLRHRATGTAGAFFPAVQQSLVVADPPGPRIGSGGATLNVLRAVAQHFRCTPDQLAHLRILLIHSGGMSQRLPAYSPMGKIFSPLPLLRPDGQISTLFDHLYITLAGLPDRLGPGMLVLAGDVFLVFDHRHVAAPQPGVTAITMRVPAETGTAHGVFLADPQSRITRTLQKATVDQMRSAGALDANDKVLIDTGLLFFDAPRVSTLANLAGVTKNPAQLKPALHERLQGQLDLYEDLTGALADNQPRRAQSKSPRTSLRGSAPHQTSPFRAPLRKAFSDTPFLAMEVEGEFLHLGTTRQFRDAMVGRNASPAAELFQQNVLAHTPTPLPPDCRVYQSVFLDDTTTSERPTPLTPSPGTPGERRGEGSAQRATRSDRATRGTDILVCDEPKARSTSIRISPHAVVEYSILAPGSRIGPGSVVSQFSSNLPLHLGENLLFFQVPVRSPDGSLRYAQVLCGVDDDFKGSLASNKCTFLNRPITDWLARHNLTPDDLWPAGLPADKRTLWTAQLFPAEPQRAQTHSALWLVETTISRSKRDKWLRSDRLSMQMILDRADSAALIEHREMVAAVLQTELLVSSMRRDENHPFDTFLGYYASPGAYRAALDRLLAFADAPATDSRTLLHQSRALWSAVQLVQRPDHPEAGTYRPQAETFARRAFSKVAQASESPASQGSPETQSHSSPLGRGGVSGPAPTNDRHRAKRSRASYAPHLPPDLTITATSPVRLDLSGGWTDTPPYCFERGGHVVNLAIDLDNRPPVLATVRTTRQPRLILHSHDLGRRIDLTEQPPGPLSVTDPFALHRVALDLTHILPLNAPDPRRAMKHLGAGLEITTECRVPKGSGLGTSSILAATLLAALHALTSSKSAIGDRQSAIPSLLSQTLLLEQRLSTGGGWQDQVGGALPALKSTTSDPGIPQHLHIEPLPLNEDLLTQLEQRLVVYYTGQQRLARDILRRVMGRWMAREPAVVACMDELKSSATRLRTALLKGRWTHVAQEISGYWRIKKELYPGSTTPGVDVLFMEMRDDYLAASLAGAGGGGFAYFLCQSPAQARRLRQRLTDRSARPGALGAVYNATLSRQGLSIQSLPA